MKKQIMFLFAALMLVGSVANAKLGDIAKVDMNDPGVSRIAKARQDIGISGPKCPLNLASVDRDADSAGSQDYQEAKAPAASARQVR